nr:immunoglobulin heavy chain junction region [Macaca mulatta]MOW98385.1 immunoglobulin heavy chain junction region [Macaca mulatta]MOW98443.1 immunoglobulin heavy chain junction region [Macaca mulatta]MOW98508.1 immunoglobulin heavy chain junction region [Macaca mulatta]MOX00542.1 immunoglobulin heavy chain junction region [Macaca mulatta]
CARMRTVATRWGIYFDFW